MATQVKHVKLQQLEEELNKNLLSDLKKLINTKDLPAYITSTGVGTSGSKSDSLSIYLDITVPTGNNKKRIAKTRIYFPYCMGALFQPNGFNFDKAAQIEHKKNNPLDLARLRILWAVYRIIDELSKGKNAIIENLSASEIWAYVRPWEKISYEAL